MVRATEEEQRMARWRRYVGGIGSGYQHPIVGGTLYVLDQLHSPQRGNDRDIVVYLPASHDAGERRYPVLYMHDGQNLFDPQTSYAGEWGVDDTLAALSGEGLEAIVVGIPNMGDQRLTEYSPFPDAHLGGGDGDAYLSFITDTIKPLIDADFRTLPDREQTGIIGSSMGGLISLYAFFDRPDVFGFAGVMSPSLWFGQGAIFRYLEAAPFTPGRLDLDIGTREGPNMVRNVQLLRDTLLAKGYTLDHSLRYVEDEGAEHNEAAWRARLREALRFLLPDPNGTAGTIPATPLAPAAD
jgi:predicted alpha/beta superfamily hydrolase